MFSNHWSKPTYAFALRLRSPFLEESFCCSIFVLTQSTTDKLAPMNEAVQNSKIVDMNTERMTTTSDAYNTGRAGVAMGGDSCSKHCEFESRHRILDGYFWHLFVVKIVMCVWKDKNKWKEAGVGPFWKKVKKSTTLNTNTCGQSSYKRSTFLESYSILEAI